MTMKTRQQTIAYLAGYYSHRLTNQYDEAITTAAFILGCDPAKLSVDVNTYIAVNALRELNYRQAISKNKKA
jgi:hypothetical protein